MKQRRVPRRFTTIGGGYFPVMTGSQDRPDNVTVEVEHTDRGWMVVHIVDGERKPIEPPYAERESAEKAAAVHAASSDRWTGAAEVVSAEDRPTELP